MKIQIGFSTSDAWYSRVIRWFTKAQVSHTFLIIDFMDRRLVLEEGVFGWSMRTLDSFAAHDRIVQIVDPKYSIESGVRESFNWLGQRYDYIGLFGMFFVMCARWLGKKIHNPLASSTSMFCSEANTKILQISGYPGADQLDASSTTPEALMEFLLQ